MNQDQNPDWRIYRGVDEPHDRIKGLPDPPPWRRFSKSKPSRFEADDQAIDLVNAALYLRRPLLITGKPGVGKTSLAYAVAKELQLGNVLRWSITTQTTRKDGLYSYDAIARLQATSLAERLKLDPPPIGQFLRLGPLGTAFAAEEKLRVLLIDEIDKSDIDLPNNLLHIFEEGEIVIPELERLPPDQNSVRVLRHDAPKGASLEDGGIDIERGRIQCKAFPLVIMTSNAEREFPPAFLRRCLRLEMDLPDGDKLLRIVRGHLFADTPADEVLKQDIQQQLKVLIDDFLRRRDDDGRQITADQLLNAVFLLLKDIDPHHHYADGSSLRDALLRSLSE